MVLAPQSWAARLGATPVTERELKAMLQPYSFRAMAFWPVEHGNMRNDSPDLFRRCGNEPSRRGCAAAPKPGANRAQNLGSCARCRRPISFEPC
jgi:hypothetical protein